MSEQGQTFAAFIARELESERDRRKVLDARGVAVVTVSGSLATLLAAVGAFVSGQEGFTLPPTAVVPLTVTLLAFAIAALCGLIATFLWAYKAATPRTLERMVTDKWPTTEVDARNVTARIDVQTIASLRKGTNIKAQLLVTALVFQVAGLAALAVAVHRVLQAAS